ncbi:hypothetical protein BBJ28_00009459 [Nothophytophthora sp. Chile5]|nr:hypothetical protein BBJ28_00009459 [Nothophytophthora sp. Chile5]
MAPVGAKGSSGAAAKAKSGASASASSSARKKDGRKASAGAAAGGTSVSMSSKKEADASASVDAALSSGDLFARNLSGMAVAHAARGVGFDAIQRTAADALTDILAKCAYNIQRIGGAAKDVAELAGTVLLRGCVAPNPSVLTVCLSTDVAQALRDLMPAPVELRDLVKTMETAKRPFPRDVPAFPARKRDLSGNTIEQTKIGRRERLPPHVPGFLPPLPNRHTYSSESRLVVEREQDAKRARLELLSQKAQVRQSLHGLQTVAATREFAPNVDGQKAQAKNQLENTSMAISKLSKYVWSSQDLGKEEKILSGTFHDGDSE